MKHTATKPYPEMVPFSDEPGVEISTPETRDESVEKLRLLWNERRFLARAALVGLVLGTLLAFLLSTRFEATTQLMPPDSQSSTGMAMLASLMGKGSVAGSLGGIAGDLLGMKSTGAVFVSVLRSATVEDRLVDRFELQKVYGRRFKEDARKKLAANTDIVEDRKSGVLTITVTDHDPDRAAAMAQAYVEELDRLVSQLSTSAAHRQRVFLERRLSEVSQDLETAEKQFGQFSSKNTAIDIKEQGKAMVEAAALLQGQLIAAQSELEAFKQIYTENNVRVKAAEARISELRNQLQQLGGTDDTQTAGSGSKNSELYPSIRKLPLLGVTYADLYRRMKVDEAVFEALTQQYEMAKVEEVKDTPSVKVLDVAKSPEKKSFPPRLLIIFLGTSFAVAGAALFVVTKARWREIEPQSPGKVLAREVLHTAIAGIRGAKMNRTLKRKYWSRFVPEDSPKDKDTSKIDL